MSTIDLRLTLIESAQCFTWKEINNVFYGIINGEPHALSTESDLTDPVIHNYLGLDLDKEALKDEVKNYPLCVEMIDKMPGLYLLRQPVWDTVVQFIISANNNVKRIKSLVDKVSLKYGEEKIINGVSVYSIPTPQKLSCATVSELNALGMGYRSPYLIKTAQMVCEGFPLNELCNMPYEEAHKKLLELMGVGDKVADCIQLFGLSMYNAFPVDTWVKKLMEARFNVAGSNKFVRESAEKMFGQNAGLVQQFLFHGARMGYFEV